MITILTVTGGEFRTVCFHVVT